MHPCARRSWRRESDPWRAEEAGNSSQRAPAAHPISAQASRPEARPNQLCFPLLHPAQQTKQPGTETAVVTTACLDAILICHSYRGGPPRLAIAYEIGLIRREMAKKMYEINCNHCRRQVPSFSAVQTDGRDEIRVRVQPTHPTSTIPSRSGFKMTPGAMSL